MEIRIGGETIGKKKPVFFIAEAGINHNGNLKLAKKMIFEAKNVGADAIKFQTFKANDLASKKSKFFKVFKKLELSDEEFGELSDYAKSKKIIFLSTPFSEDAVEVLAKLKVPVYKIASGDLTNIPLIKYVASKNKPIILSTGMSNIAEIKKAITSINSQKNNKIIILHSISSYPPPLSDINLNAIKKLQDIFQYPIGFSDNGNNDLVTITSVVLGSVLIEKHFTLNKKFKGPDHVISAEPKQLKNIINQIHEIRQILGDGNKKCQPSELENRLQARRSIVSVTKIKKNEKIRKEFLAIKRPALGLEPKYFEKLIGRKALRDIPPEHPLKWKDIKK